MNKEEKYKILVEMYSAFEQQNSTWMIVIGTLQLFHKGTSSKRVLYEI